MKYFYNQKTGTLHIEGFCRDSKTKCKEYLVFNSYNEALSHDGNSVRMCKSCEKKKEKLK